MNKENKLQMVSVRLVKEKSLLSNQPIDNPDVAIQVLSEEIKQYDREVVVVINLQSDKRPINASIVSIGSINSSLVVPRDVLKNSILSNAASVIMLHNHPSGSCSPSKADITATKRMKESYDLLGINLVDHIIVGYDQNYSFAAESCLFNEPDHDYNIKESFFKNIENEYPINHDVGIEI